MSAIPKFKTNEMIWSIDGDVMKWLRISSTEILKGRIYYNLIKKRATEKIKQIVIKKPQSECFKNLDSLIDYDMKYNLK